MLLTTCPGYAALYILAYAAAAHGLNVPFKKVSLPSLATATSSRLAYRDDPYGFQNMKDNVYTAELWVAGQNYTVSPWLLDTRFRR